MYQEWEPLAEFGAIKSVTGNTKTVHQALDYLRPFLSGYRVEEFEKDGIPSLLAYNSDTRPDYFKVVLNGHLDVVDALDSQFVPRFEDGKLYFRGASDMKAGTFVETMVFSELAKTLPYPIALQLVTDEETGGYNGTKYQIDRGVRADFVISGEPSGLQINNKNMGMAEIRAVARGKSAHSAFPWEGDNAIWKMHDFLDQVKREFPQPSKNTWASSLNLAKINTLNESINVIPDFCSAEMDIRFTPEDSDYYARMSELAKKTGVDLKTLTEDAAHFTPEDHPLLQALKRSAEDCLKSPVDIFSIGAVTDVRHYDAVGGNGVAFGPRGEGFHGDNEYVDLKSAAAFRAILKNFLLLIK